MPVTVILHAIPLSSYLFSLSVMHSFQFFFTSFSIQSLFLASFFSYLSLTSHFPFLLVWYFSVTVFFFHCRSCFVLIFIHQSPAQFLPLSPLHVYSCFILFVILLFPRFFPVVSFILVSFIFFVDLSLYLLFRCYCRVLCPSLSSIAQYICNISFFFI